MGKSINEVRILGHLGQDPDVRATAGGSTVANLSIATSERRKDQAGNWVDHTEWHRLVAFGKVADVIATYCRKGDRLHVSGRLQTRKWQDKDGQDRYSTEIVIDDVVLIGGQGQGQSQADPAASRQADRQATRAQVRNEAQVARQAHGPATEEFEDDDIPFSVEAA